LFLHLFFFGFDGQLNDFLLDKVKAEPQFHRGEPKGSLDFIQKVIVYLGVKTEKKHYVSINTYNVRLMIQPDVSNSTEQFFSDSNNGLLFFHTSAQVFIFC
jgi:hypothetical protein